MLFTIKKLISALLQPFTLLLLIMGIALLLLWFTERQKAGKFMLSICWLILFSLSLQPIADRWLAHFEKYYSVYRGKKSDFNYIVVLGGKYTYDPTWSSSPNLLNDSLARVVEGIKLFKQYSGKKLVFTGAGSAEYPISSAQLAAQVAISLGVSAKKIITLNKPRDTQEEAIAVKKLVGSSSFLLVSSAYHLPRAMAIFRQQGLNPIPAAANHLASYSPQNGWGWFLPSATYLQHSQYAWHETLGLYWFQLITYLHQPILSANTHVEK